jgi:hypothetical protein
VHRFHQVLLIGSFLPLSWLAMMVVHELGHVLGAWLTGGSVARVVLHPLTISRTELSDNPAPLVVTWSGPIFGALFPVLALGIVQVIRLPGLYLFRFFAGFCLIANGAYLGAGSFDRIGDAGDLLRFGADIRWLWVFGAATVPLGLLLWHGQGEHFGLGKAQGRVNPTAAYLSLGLFVLLVGAELFFGGE